jgi:tRNA-dihydrouridine synthase
MESQEIQTTTQELVGRGFWDKLPKPFFVLAPMYDVTDVVFRNIFLKTGRPDVFFTEFVSTDGLSNPVGREKLMHHLWLTKEESPTVAQIFGAKPEHYKTTAALIQELGFAGIDINMGCPDKNIIKGGSCAALYKTPDLAKELILSAKEGAPLLPVSCKIRIGDTKIDWQDWIDKLLEAQPAAITIHLRTRKEMSKVDAHWELMPEIVKFIYAHTTPETRPLIIGNGDVKNITDGLQKQADSNCDGIMIGRGVFGNPWVFNKVRANVLPTPEERIELMLEHTKKFLETYDGIKHYDIMKRHFKSYVSGFDGAAELRAKLFEEKDFSGIEKLSQDFLKNLK